MYLEIIFKLIGRCKSNTEILTRPPRSELTVALYLAYVIFLLLITHTHTHARTHARRTLFSFLHHLTVVCRYHATSKSAGFVSCPNNVLFSKSELVSFSSRFFIWKNSVFKDFCKGSVKPLCLMASDFFEEGAPFPCGPALSLGLLVSPQD